MTGVSWRRVVSALSVLGCKVHRETEFAIHMNRAAALVVTIRKISPVTRARQRDIVSRLQLEMPAYLEALAGTGPPISDD